MSDETIAVGFVEDNGGTNKLIQAVNRLADAADKLVSAEGRAEKATESQGKAARKAGSDNDYLSKTMGGAANAASGFAGALGAITAGFGISKIASYADTYTNLQNKLRLVTVDQKATNAAIEASYAIAQRTYAPLDSTAELYGKMSQTLKAVGKDTKDAGKLTEAFTGALALSGATTQQVQSATLQFSQAMGQNNIQMEEFGQLIDSAPALIDALAQGMKNGMGISRGELISLAKTGQLTRDQLISALGAVAPRLQAAMAQVAPSLSQAFNNLQNSVIMYIGKTNEANSVTGRISQAILLLANNMNVVAPVLLTLVGALTAMAAVSVGTMLFNLASSMLVLATNAALAAVALGTTLLVPLVALGAALGVFYIALQATGTTFAQFVAMLPGGQSVLDAWNKVVEFGKNKVSELNKSLNDVKNSLNGAGKGAGDAAKGTDTLAKSAKSAADKLKEEKEASDKLIQSLQSSKDASDKLYDSTLQVIGGARSTAEAFNIASDILMNRYSVEAANAAQKAATLMDNLYGSGSAAAQAASQYDQAASSANNYASAADAASSAGSGGSISQRNFGSQNPYSSGQTEGFGGFFIGKLTEKMNIGDTETFVTKNSYEKFTDTFDAMKQAEKNANALMKQNPNLSAAEALVQSFAVSKTPRYIADELLSALNSQNPVTANYKEKTTTAKFAHGGDFRVGGNGGTDSQLVKFWASPNETVSVRTPAQAAKEQDNEPRGRRGRGGVYIGNFSVVAKDTDSFRNTRRQTMRDTVRDISKAIG